MKIKRTIPPATAPLDCKALAHGFWGLFSSASYTRMLEQELREYFNVKHVFLVSSGKSALALILNALNALRPDRTKVLIPAYTCFSVPSAVVKAGLAISLCDVEEKTFDYDYEQLTARLDGETLCVVANNLFGVASKVETLKRICREKDIFVIEDAAQAMGVGTETGFIGTRGDVGFFSLGRGKNITAGSGGIVVTNSDAIAGAITTIYRGLDAPSFGDDFLGFLKATLLSIFVHPRLYWFPASLPFLRLGETIFYNDFPIKKLSGMEAGLLRGWQRRLADSNRLRSAAASFYGSALRLRVDEKKAVPYLRMPIMMKNRHVREILQRIAREEGLGITGMYPAPVNEIKEIRSRFPGEEYPCAKKISQCLLTLPTHPFVSDNDRKRVCRYMKAQESILSLTDRALDPRRRKTLMGGAHS